MYRKSLKSTFGISSKCQQTLHQNNQNVFAARLSIHRNLSTDSSDTCIVTEKRDRVCWIRLNRPKQLNAITSEMYVQLRNQFETVAKEPDVKLVVVTGTGRYFSSGNDLNNYDRDLEKHGGNLLKASQTTCDELEQFINTVVDFPKPLIAAVNGPSIGIMFTILGLFDTVVCSDTAHFQTPFSALGLSPEGCSSRTFPRIFGTSLTTELLCFNYTMSAKEALQQGFVSRVIPTDQFESHLEKWLYDKKKGLVNTCYPNSMFNAKALVQNETERRLLREANKRECNVLFERFQSEDRKEALAKKLAKKK